MRDTNSGTSGVYASSRKVPTLITYIAIINMK